MTITKYKTTNCIIKKVSPHIRKLSREKWEIDGAIYHLAYESNNFKMFYMGEGARLVFDYYESVGEIKNEYLWIPLERPSIPYHWGEIRV